MFVWSLQTISLARYLTNPRVVAWLLALKCALEPRLLTEILLFWATLSYIMLSCPPCLVLFKMADKCNEPAIYPSQCNVEKTIEMDCILWPVPAFGWAPVIINSLVSSHALQLVMADDVELINGVRENFIDNKGRKFRNSQREKLESFVNGQHVFLFQLQKSFQYAPREKSL